MIRHAMRCVLDLKDGPLDPPIASDVANLQPIREGLGISGFDRIYSRDLMETIKGGGTDDFTMRRKQKKKKKKREAHRTNTNRRAVQPSSVLFRPSLHISAAYLR